MANLRERIPMEFSDDARWGRFFTNTHVVVMILLAAFSLLFWSIMNKVGFGTVGILLAISFDIVTMLTVMLPINDFSSLFNPAGIPLAVILFRAVRRKRRRRIYVKKIEDEGDSIS